MKKLLLLLSVLTLAFCAQAGVMSIQNANYRHVKNHQVVKPAISQADAEALQANHSLRVITTMPEDSTMSPRAFVLEIKGRCFDELLYSTSQPTSPVDVITFSIGAREKKHQGFINTSISMLLCWIRVKVLAMPSEQVEGPA